MMQLAQAIGDCLSGTSNQPALRTEEDESRREAEFQGLKAERPSVHRGARATLQRALLR